MSNIRTLSLDLAQVKAQFQAWRRERVGRERIPEDLWEAALQLLEHYPLGLIQRELCLNLNQLKKRSSPRQNIKTAPSQPTFLELNSADIAPFIPTPTQQERICRITFESSNGCRLKIQLPAEANIIPAICAKLLRD